MRVSKTSQQPFRHVTRLSVPNMTGRPRYRTMEMIGGSSVSYLARTPCVPLFSTLFNRGVNRRAFGLLGEGGDHFHCTVEPSPGHIRYVTRLREEKVSDLGMCIAGAAAAALRGHRCSNATGSPNKCRLEGCASTRCRHSWGRGGLMSAEIWEEQSMDPCQSRGTRLTNFQCHWSIRRFSLKPRHSGVIVSKTPLKEARNENAIEAAILNRVLDRD